jgi:CHAT domain-containing protein
MIFDRCLYSIMLVQMNFQAKIFKTAIIIMLCMYCFRDVSGCDSVIEESRYSAESISYLSFQDSISTVLKKLNDSLITSLVASDYNKGQEIYNKISKHLQDQKITDSITLSDLYYYSGTFNLAVNRTAGATKMLEMSGKIRELIRKEDAIYSRILSNTGLAYYKQGDNIKAVEYYNKALESEKRIYGESNPELIQDYSNLASAYLEINNYEDAIISGDSGLTLANRSVGKISPSVLFLLLHNMGISYIRLEDYRKAQVYLQNALSLFDTRLPNKGDNYINLINSLGVCFNSAGMIDKAIEYYETGIKTIGSNVTPVTLNFTNSYAIMLGNAGFIDRGNLLLSNSLARARLKFGENSREYIIVLKNYANYLNDYCKDPEKAIEYYLECKKYITDHEWDINLKDQILTGYSTALSESGKYELALKTVQEVLSTGITGIDKIGLFENPGIEELDADKRTLRIIAVKYQILSKMFEDTHDLEVLVSAANTSERLIAILERVRLNISEEESRLILGDNYRKLYINAIRDYETVYKLTGEQVYLEKAFEYSERSKVAGLLASTREMKATQFNIPVEIADVERDLQLKIGTYREMIINENAIEEPDVNKIRIWNGYVMEATQKRDSLIKVLEKEYPEYYKIKYNTEVISINDIADVTGRKDTYLSFVISDTVLYSFIVNKNYQKLISTTIDSGFYNNLNEFIKLLSNPSESKETRENFNRFRELGNKLFLILLDPVKEYMTNGRLIISPDNNLSYLPFETLLTKPGVGDDLIYRNLPYVLFEYDITYAYSATLLAETMKQSRSLNNRIIAFAPRYANSLNIDSLIISRQNYKGVLRDLPYAREEAKYVAKSSKNALFLNEEASETAFKTNAGKYDIIHMAMHTFLYDTDPMYSKMLFSSTPGDNDDNMLNTYEIYNIPLTAKMVVLSSCNTGIGLIHSGEGVMSLARGFVFSGSESVVMSMWEVEDKSGITMIKLFYDNLRNGNTKSMALRRARQDFLKNADQLRSHPYFWATLIIYGNNTPLYYSKWEIITIPALLLLIFGFSIFYFRNR